VSRGTFTVKLIEKIGIGAVLGLLFIVLPVVVTLMFLGLAMWVSQNYGPAYAILLLGLFVVLLVTGYRDNWRDLGRDLWRGLREPKKTPH
jgi:hypothetical protein